MQLLIIICGKGRAAWTVTRGQSGRNQPATRK